jgi:hypothetical protein
MEILSKMNSTKLFPYLSIITFLAYFLSNINSNGISSGKYLLISALSLSIISYAFNIERLNKKIYIPLFLLISLFYIYVFYLSLFTRPDLSATINSLFDSNGGALYTFLIGIFLSSSLSCVLNPERGKADWCWIFIFSAVVFSLGYFLFEALSYGFKETAILSINQDHDGYQRMGTMTIIINLILGVALINNFEKTKKGRILLLLYCIYSVLAATLSILSLSNSGFITNIVLMISSLCIIVYLYKGNKNQIFLSFYCKYTLYAMFFVVLLIIALFITESGVSRLRLFDMSNNSSFLSRYNLLKSNFWEQFSINPFWGNMHSDVLVNGTSGEYVHSILSLFTHTGVVGAAIFSAIIATVYVKTVRLIRGNNPIGMFLNVNLSVLLFISLLSSFFNWVPLWICILLSTHLIKRGHRE